MPTEETYDEATTATAPIRTWRTWMLSRRPEARAARGAPKGAPWTDLTARRRCFVVGEEKKKESVWRAWPACSLSSCASSRLLVLLSLGMSTKKKTRRPSTTRCSSRLRCCCRRAPRFARAHRCLQQLFRVWVLEVSEEEPGCWRFQNKGEGAEGRFQKNSQAAGGCRKRARVLEVA